MGSSFGDQRQRINTLRLMIKQLCCTFILESSVSQRGSSHASLGPIRYLLLYCSLKCLKIFSLIFFKEEVQEATTKRIGYEEPVVPASFSSTLRERQRDRGDKGMWKWTKPFCNVNSCLWQQRPISFRPPLNNFSQLMGELKKKMAENLIAGANREYNIEGREIHVIASYSEPKKKENTMCIYFGVFMLN